MAELVTNVTAAQVRHAAMGFRSQSLTKTVPQNATSTVFTVSGGSILVTGLTGVVTTVIGGTTPSAKYVSTPTAGTAVDICSATAITGKEVGAHVGVTGKVGTALDVQNAGAGSSLAAGQGIVIPPGTIGFNTSAADATGALTHTLTYIPLDDAARVVAS